MPKLTQGPDPNPKKPKLKAPPGACDTHIHLFGPAAKYPFAPDSPYTARDALPETFTALQDKLGLSTAVIVSPGGYGRNYSLLADVLTKYPQRFRGIALLRDDTPSSEIGRLTRLGVRGMRMMSHKRGQHVPNYSKEIAARVHKHGWHIQFYPHGTDIIEYADKLLALPNPIVLDHFASIPAAGGVDQPAVKVVLKMLDSGKVWLKLSGPMRCTNENFPYPSVTPLAHIFVKHAPERLVWGSDWPHVNLDGREMPNDGDLLDLLAEWVPEAKVRNRILTQNAKALYGF
ncbi:MAG: 2-pyrone-4,6-dicarboxylate lactonase [Alphaproteobacteria bacterium]|nr:2-pyrone-4,6-dicarboxylate lactonase [Alphaproteobacteria bacterium]